MQYLKAISLAGLWAAVSAAPTPPAPSSSSSSLRVAHPIPVEKIPAEVKDWYWSGYSAGYDTGLAEGEYSVHGMTSDGEGGLTTDDEDEQEYYIDRDHIDPYDRDPASLFNTVGFHRRSELPTASGNEGSGLTTAKEEAGSSFDPLADWLDDIEKYYSQPGHGTNALAQVVHDDDDNYNEHAKSDASPSHVEIQVCKPVRHECCDTCKCRRPYWYTYTCATLPLLPTETLHPRATAPMNPHDQNIHRVGAAEFDLVQGGPVVPYSEVVHRIHAQYPSAALEPLPNEVCKEVAPSADVNDGYVTPFWFCASKPEYFDPGTDRPLPTITFVPTAMFDALPGALTTLGALLVLEQGNHPAENFSLEFGRYGSDTPCLGTVVECLYALPCWQSQWTCEAVSE
ncbi:hypothetical protein BDW02DRAFT_248290 [Decorospora gaudefroyi]|uniref:Uncharacterized protein n=1 Tax=Decorospora gaudefroyi TaxID=184978 RepID=A0A6A5KK01_9PLEO|nr:hypothetical protein BDW02DRAFT_248290 [Decorospora gaudefroyi]